MPKITALIHAYPNDATRLGRLLETLQPCDEILVINHNGEELTRVARERGATVKLAVPGVDAGAYVVDAHHDWILGLLPTESLSESLQAALLDWKDGDHEQTETFSLPVRNESPSGWEALSPVTRLVNRNLINWVGDVPDNDPNSRALTGDLLRFSTP